MSGAVSMPAEAGGAPMPAFVPMHPEAGADAQEVRWVVPAGILPLVGEVASAPGALGALLADGTVASMVVQPRAVAIRLADGCDWGAWAACVRDALAEALLRPQAWVPTVATTDDDVLRAALQDVIDGPAGDFVRSHGGEVAIVAVADDCAQVRMSGACEHCPALGFTLRGRLESELRQRYPALRELRAAQDAASARPARPVWRLTSRRSA